jgi:putative addiction module component (TIGR02574 family)
MKMADFPAIQKLSTREKLELIDELWMSMGPDLDEISAEEKRILDQRWAEFEKNPQSALTLEELQAKLASRKK